MMPSQPQAQLRPGARYDQLGEAAGVAEFAQPVGIEARQHRHDQDPELAVALAVGGGFDDVAVAVDGDKADPALGRPPHPLPDSLADVEHLGVEKDFRVPLDQFVEQPVETGRECQPQPDLEKRDEPVEPLRQIARLGDAGHVESDDQPVFDPFGDIARLGHRSRFRVPGSSSNVVSRPPGGKAAIASPFAAATRGLLSGPFL